MSDEIKVSVIMPVYNAEKYLADSLGTVVEQTLREIEIICVDDGSTDDSRKVIAEYMEKDDRITLLQQKNQYAGIARNTGLKKCSGEYVVFWDADDRFALDALEKLYNKAKQDDADISICDMRKWDSEANRYVLPPKNLNKEYIPEHSPFSVKDIPQYIFNFATNNPWNKMYRRSFLEKNGLYFQGCKRANDVFFVMQALYLAERMTVVDERLIDYRYNNSDSLTGSLTEENTCIYEAHLATYQALKERGAFENELVLQSFANKALNKMIHSLDIQTSEESAKELFDMLLAGGFQKLGIEDREDYYYSPNVHACYKTMLTGSLISTLLLMKTQKEKNLETHRQKLCRQRMKVAKLTAKVENLSEKLERKKEELKHIRNQIPYKVIRKLHLVKELPPK